MDVKPVNQTRSGPIAESLQARPYQGGSAVPLIEKTARVLQLQSILHNLFAECLDLAK